MTTTTPLDVDFAGLCERAGVPLPRAAAPVDSMTASEEASIAALQKLENKARELRMGGDIDALFAGLAERAAASDGATPATSSEAPSAVDYAALLAHLSPTAT